MSTLASAVIAKARYDLIDDGTRFPDAELLAHLNDGQVLIAMLVPSANPITTQVSLVAGPKQALPAGSLKLAEVSANVTGSTRGTVPQLLSFATLSGILPNWQAETAAATVQIVAYNPVDPLVFWTFPPQPAGTAQKLELMCAALPTVVAATANNITLPDQYVPALVDYLVYRACNKDSESPAAATMSAAALAGFARKLGVTTAAVQQAQAA